MESVPHAIPSRRGFDRSFPDFVPALRQVTLGFALVALLPLPAMSDPTVEVTSFEFTREGARSIGTPAGLRFRAFGRTYELTLEPNRALVAAGAKLEFVGDESGEEALAPSTWIGRDPEHPDVEARLTLDGNHARGTVRSSAGTLVFEPSSTEAEASGAHDVRRGEEVLAAAGPLPCGADPREVVTPPAGDAAAGMRSATRAIEKTLGLSLVADAAFYRRFGVQAAERMQALVNEADGIFRSDLGIGLEIVQMVIYTSDAAQPFSATATSTDLLNQLSAAREGEAAGALGLGGVTHLFSGRGIGGPSGIAWIAGVCDAHYGAGISSITSAPGYLETILVTHELGHNLGASHDGPSGYGCDTTTFGWIMWPVLDGGLLDEFSTCSRARIAKQIPLAACIGDVTPSTCGNGVLDEGEGCDDGNVFSGDCCRADCRYDVAGMPCGESPDVCYDAVCDGAGSCELVPNEATCAGEDACMEGRCSNGACVSGEEPKEFETIAAKFRVGKDGMLGSAKLSATVNIQEFGSDPCTAGLEIVTTVGGETVYDEFIPADQWEFKSAGNYGYKTTTPSPGGVKSAKVRFGAMTRKATFRFVMADPMVGTAPEPPTVFVLAGGRSDGQCGTGDHLRCLRRGSSYNCE